METCSFETFKKYIFLGSAVCDLPTVLFISSFFRVRLTSALMLWNSFPLGLGFNDRNNKKHELMIFNE